MAHRSFDELRRVMHETADLLKPGEFGGADSIELRTRQLARTFEREPEADRLRVLTFQLGGEQYGWPVGSVRAIASAGRLTPIPSAPPFYRGVTSMRGGVLSVMDLRVYLGSPPSDPIPELLIVIGGANLEIGVLADDVFDVVSLRPTDLTGAGLEPDLIRAVTADGLSILDAEALLGREWRRVNDERGN